MLSPSVRSRLWPLWVALLVAAVHLPYLFPGGPWARRPGPLVLGQDEGTVLYDSHRIAIGQVMYRDFFEFQGPVFYYLHAGLFELTGGPSLPAARAVGILVSALGAAFLGVLVARFAGRAAGVGAALIHAFLLQPMWPFDYPHWYADTLALAGLVLLTRRDPRPRDEIGAGVCLALSALTIQSLGVPVLAAAVATCMFGRTFRSPLRVLAGAAIPTAIVAVYFAAQGALGDLVYAMFIWPMKHYGLGQGAATRYAWGMAESLREHQQQLREPWLTLAAFSIRVAVVLPLWAFPAAVVTALRWRHRRDGSVIIAGAALAAIAPLWLAPVRPDLVHVALVGGFGLMAAAVTLAPLVPRWRRSIAAGFCLVAVAVGASYVYKTVRTWPASRAMGDWREESLKLTGARTLAETTRPDDTIVVGAMGGFYYIYVRPSAVPNTYIPATLPAYLSEAQWRRIADDIAAKRPAALLLVGSQWEQVRKRRPDLDKAYRRSGVLLFRIDSSSATDNPTPNSTQRGTASGGE